MKSLKWPLLFLALTLLVQSQGQAQSKSNVATLWADSIVTALEENHSEKFEDGLLLADSALHIFELHGDVCQQIKAKILRSSYLDGLGQSDQAISELLWCLNKFKQPCDSMLQIKIYINLAMAQLSLTDYSKAIETCDVGLNLCNPTYMASNEYLGLMNNKGIALASMGQFDEANQIFVKLLGKARRMGDSKTEGQTLINIGTIKGITNENDSAYYYFSQALTLFERIGDYDGMMDNRLNLSIFERNRGKYKEAFQLLNDYRQEALTHTDYYRLARYEVEAAETFRLMEQFDSAYVHLSYYLGLKDSLLNEERVKAVAEMEEKYEAVKKAKQIDELKLDNLNAALANEKVKRTRNVMYAGVIVLLISLYFLYVRFKTIRRNRNELVSKNKIIEIERKRSDDLLKNILPDDVAEELKQSGKARAQAFELTTILFSDFKGFTSIAEKLSPEDLVNELDICFQAFDRIIGKYHLEKIKTIGDAYMAVGGIPDRSHHEPAEMVLAAIEMQEFMMSRKLELEATGHPAFSMRIGIHSGPVVAGVVGMKKFQYDVWGDSVNTASRMESSGDIDKVNISETTYELVKSHAKLAFEYRGKIAAKGKGEMAMYFAQRG